MLAIEASEVEPEQDLGDAVPLGLRITLQLLEADTFDELGDEHALA